MSASSVQSQVIAAVVALLGAIGDAPAFRSKMSAFTIAQLPARNVMPEDGETEYTLSSAADRTFRFNVRHTVAATDEVDAAADPLYVATAQALLADITLGGLVTVIREGKQKWEMERGEIAVVALVVTYVVEFSTSRSDPSVKRF
jgi:hypothetical protein